MSKLHDTQRSSLKTGQKPSRLFIALLAAFLTLFSALTAICCMNGMGMGSMGMNGMGMGMNAATGTSGIVDTVRFAPAATCAQCHNHLYDTQGQDVSIHADWEGTVMANAGRDPIWQAKVNSEVLRIPHLRSIIEERCSRCHTAMARVEAQATGGEPLLTGTGFFNITNPYHALANESVSCTMCHQILPGTGDKSEFTGNYPFDSNTARPQRQLFGPYADPFAMPMVRMAAFTPAKGEQTEESSLCSHCHTLYVPFVDDSGKVVGESPEQTPYLEWLASSFAQKEPPGYRSCQGCHLPHDSAAAWVASMPRHLAPREGFALHHLVGGNVFLLSLLEKQGASFETTAPPERFGITRQRTEAMLRENTATVAVESPRKEDDFIEIPVRVTNLAGHKFPTGVPARRAWLHVTVRDESGAVIFESGGYQPDGSITGNAADADLSSYEPHYDRVDAQDQVQIYEMVMGDIADRVTYTFVRAKDHLKDNRLLPAGFSKAKAADDIRVHGAAHDDPNFTGGSDLVTYRIARGVRPGGRYRISVELLYQPVSYPFLKDLLTLREKSEAIGKIDKALKETPIETFIVTKTTIEL